MDKGIPQHSKRKENGMDDRKIIDLYFARSEDAVTETKAKYGRYCYSIAYGILGCPEDAEECENDTYIRAWNAIPPQMPAVLSAFLGRITRNLALDRYDREKAQKRYAATAALDELAECLPAPDGGGESDKIALSDAINSFLDSLPAKTRIMFLRRYWYMLSVKEIADGMKMTESNVKITLMRTREKFRNYLESKGIIT